MVTSHRASDGTVEISSDGITYTAIGNVVSFEWTPEEETTTVTNQDTDWVATRHSKSKVSWNFDFIADNTDSGQGLIFTAAAGQKNDTYYYMRFRTGVGSGFEECFGQVVITSVPRTNTDGEHVKKRCSGVSYESMTIQDQ